jgi:hypothetical protein
MRYYLDTNILVFILLKNYDEINSKISYLLDIFCNVLTFNLKRRRRFIIVETGLPHLQSTSERLHYYAYNVTASRLWAGG